MATDMDEAAAGLFDSGGKALPEAWRDTTGALAAGEIGRLAYSYSIVGVRSRAVCSVLSGLDLAFTGAKSRIAAWLAECATRGFRVSDTGTVMLGADAKTSGSLADQLNRASMITTELTAALEDATVADQRAAQALTGIGLTELNINGEGDINADDLELHRDRILPEGVDTGLEIIRKTMPLDDSPTVQSTWWDGLSGTQRDMYLKAVPLEIAGMAGISVAVRRHLSEPERGYDRLKLLEFARDHWDDTSIDWTHTDSNCTNFVSQAFEHAGLEQKGKPGFLWRWDEDEWGHARKKFLFFDFGDDYSNSWGGAQQQHDFFVSQRAQIIDPVNARPGDILYVTNEGTTGEIHHTALVTGVLPNGDILYTQHSDSAQNLSWNGRLPYTHVQGGTQGVQIVRVTETW